MKKIRSIIILTLALILTVAALTGCGGNLADKTGGIVSLTLATDEILLAIADKNDISAISNLSTDPGLSNIVDKAADFKNRLGTTDIEKVIALKPKIVFVADWTDEKIVKQLTDAKIDVYVYTTPNSIEEVRQLIRDIAAKINKKAEGDKLIEWMDKRLQAVADKISTLDDSQKLTGMSCDSFFYTYGKGTTFDDIAKNAGIINAASQAGMEKWQQISKEKIIEVDPDLIFLPAWSYSGFDAEEFAKDFKADISLSTVKAIKNDRVFSLPESHMTSVSQNIVLGVEDAAKAAYPDLFK